MAVGYPTPLEAPYASQAATAYKNTPENNPTLAGWPLVILSRVVQHVSPLSRFLWHTNNFGTLKDLNYLDRYPTRYDPCVVPSESPPTEPISAGNFIITHPLFSATDHVFYTSADYVKAYTRKRTTPTAVAEYLLSLIRSRPHSLAFADIKDDRTLSAAKASTERYAQGKPLGPLDGVPITVKDEVDVNGYTKTLGSSMVFGGRDCETAWAVKKLEEAGAIIIAKANMHELGADITNNNPAKGTPRNPYNTKYYTGGSSGGSAYAVGAGLVPIAVGADGGGSIRVPSNFCGVYGIKPSHGRVSERPSPNLAHTNSVIGPIAATLDDLALAYRIMATPDSLDPTSGAFPSPTSALSPLVSPTRKLLGIFRPWFDDSLPSVQKRCQSTVQKLVDTHGYEVVEIDLPHLQELRLAHALSIITELHAAAKGNVSGFSASNRILLSVAAQTPAQSYLRTAQLRALVMSHLAHLYTTHPGLVIVSPTTPIPGIKIRSEGDLVHGVSDGNTTLRGMRYVFLANFSGCPAIVSGVGYDDDDKSGSGLMVSLMGMAEWGKEEALLGFARDVASVSGMDGDKRKKGEVWVDVLGAVGAGREAA
ncbi:hypothetical protein EUX98_g3928 [Antrodiella citrinella]|uniref:Amidase domain-containing protein n=1 Tax=Antrodiella citrinella TaxID=2447956 RepID=A0A4S4MXD4_9APHY|nr:hypothetical protein EUX98_g3928 [Antrodiella citrinella]